MQREPRPLEGRRRLRGAASRWGLPLVVAALVAPLGACSDDGATGTPSSDAEVVTDGHDHDGHDHDHDGLGRDGDGSREADGHDHDAHAHDHAAPDVGDGSEADAAETEGAEQLPLTEPEAWEAVAAEADPFWPDDGSEPAVCEPEHYGPEDTPDGPVFELTTTECGWATFRQPALEPVTAGATLRVWIFYFELTEAGGPYELAVALGDPAEVVWEQSVATPSDSDFFLDEVEIEASWPEGTPVYWHVANHGENSWNVRELSVSAP